MTLYAGKTLNYLSAWAACNFPPYSDALKAFAAQERATAGRCAKIAMDAEFGDERQDTIEAFNNGMTYTAGACDAGGWIAERISALATPKKEDKS